MTEYFTMKKLAVLLFVIITLKLTAVEKPNIIFILADDLSYRDLSCYGQRKYQTPNLDDLAVNGVRFAQAYAASPECAPSRGCLMTGLHTGHGPIRRNSSARGQDNLRDSDLTIAEVLKKAGYNTGFTGKWGIGLPGTEGVPYKQGFDYCFGYYDQTRAHTFIPQYLWENDRKIEYPENAGFDMKKRYDYKGNKPVNTYDEDGKLYIEELKDPYGYTYSQDEIEKAALEFLERNDPHKTQQPFFLYYATHLPHGPVIIDDIGDLNQPDSVMQLSREWGAMVKRIDTFVGELIANLKASNNYENTIIFFASDNGYSMCGYTDRGNMPDWPDDPWLKNKGPFTGGKFSVLEGGIRVPFFVSWPAKIKPALIQESVWLPDFFPTAAELAGFDNNAFKTDGKSLIPLLQGRESEFEKHEHLYFARDREQAVVMGSWKAYRKNPDQKTKLFLITEDTYSQNDLAPLYPEVVKKAEFIMDNDYTTTEWYWDPCDSKDEYMQKKQKAIETDNVLPVNRPNGIAKFPWEK